MTVKRYTKVKCDTLNVFFFFLDKILAITKNT